MPKGLKVQSTGSAGDAGYGSIHQFLDDGSVVLGSGSLATNASLTLGYTPSAKGSAAGADTVLIRDTSTGEVKTLTVTQLQGSASTITVADGGDNDTTVYLLGSTSAASSTASVLTDAQLTYNNDTNVLSTTTLSGTIATSKIEDVGGNVAITSRNGNTILANNSAGGGAGTTVVSTDGTHASALMISATAGGIRIGGTTGVTIDGTTGETIGANGQTTALQGSLTVAQNVTITGNLSVDGTTTTIDTSSLVVQDKNIQIAVPADGGTATDGSTNEDAGITISGSASDKTFVYKNSGTRFVSSENLDLASGKTYKINNTDVLSATTLGSAVVASSLTSVGTIATGVWQGTDVGVAHGGTGASTASDARTNLGLAIGSDVQAYDAELAALAGLTSAADKGIQFTGDGTAATYDLTAAGKALLDDADAAAQRTTLGLDSMATQSKDAVNIDGGAIDATIIGANSAAAGTFTTLTGTTVVSGSVKVATARLEDAGASLAIQGGANSTTAVAISSTHSGGGVEISSLAGGTVVTSTGTAKLQSTGAGGLVEVSGSGGTTIRGASVAMPTAVSIGVSAADTLTLNSRVDGDIRSNADAAHNLGDATNAWAVGYIDTIDASAGTLALKADTALNIGTDNNVAVSIGGASSTTTINGNLTVAGAVTVNTTSTTNTIIKDAIIMINSGSDAASGLVVDRSTANLGGDNDMANGAFFFDGTDTGIGTFKFGVTNDDASDASLSVADDDLSAVHLGTMKSVINGGKAAHQALLLDMWTNTSNYSGTMFYLSAAYTGGNASVLDAFSQAGKWYFVEGSNIFPSPFVA